MVMLKGPCVKLSTPEQDLTMSSGFTPRLLGLAGHGGFQRPADASMGLLSFQLTSGTRQRAGTPWITTLQCSLWDGGPHCRLARDRKGRKELVFPTRDKDKNNVIGRQKKFILALLNSISRDLTGIQAQKKTKKWWG